MQGQFCKERDFKVKARKNGFWVFGYGSLMWRPNFDYLEAQPALVRGYHRALCVYSTRYRGTSDCPGLVLGLDRGGACKGRAFLVAAENKERVMAYLHRREMDTKVYSPRYLGAILKDGTQVSAYSFVVNRDHHQYTGKLDAERSAALILQGRGRRGTSLEYLRNTVSHLDELGVGDGPLHSVLDGIIDRAEKTKS